MLNINIEELTNDEFKKLFALTFALTRYKVDSLVGFSKINDMWMIDYNQVRLSLNDVNSACINYIFIAVDDFALATKVYDYYCAVIDLNFTIDQAKDYVQSYLSKQDKKLARIL